MRFLVGVAILLAGCATPLAQMPLPREHPANSQADEAPLPPELLALSIEANDRKQTGLPASGPTIYTCPMHKQVVSNRPGNCPICKMKLVPKGAVTQPATMNSVKTAQGVGAGEGK